MYTIGTLAKRARVKTDSIRFYERQRLIAPATKTRAGYRLYTDVALRRVSFIKHAQLCGFSLTEIGELLQMHLAEPKARKAACRLAAEKKRQINRTLAALQAMSDALSCLLLTADDDADISALSPSEESPLLTALETYLSAQSGRQRVPHPSVPSRPAPSASMPGETYI